MISTYNTKILITGPNIERSCDSCDEKFFLNQQYFHVKFIMQDPDYDIYNFYSMFLCPSCASYFGDEKSDERV